MPRHPPCALLSLTFRIRRCPPSFEGLHLLLRGPSLPSVAGPVRSFDVVVHGALTANEFETDRLDPFDRYEFVKVPVSTCMKQIDLLQSSGGLQETGLKWT